MDEEGWFHWLPLLLSSIELDWEGEDQSAVEDADQLSDESAVDEADQPSLDDVLRCLPFLLLLAWYQSEEELEAELSLLSFHQSWDDEGASAQRLPPICDWDGAAVMVADAEAAVEAGTKAAEEVVSPLCGSAGVMRRQNDPVAG